MISRSVVGLLDRPNRQSLGMVGLIVDCGEGGFRTEGFVDVPARLIEIDEFAQLLSTGDALRANGPPIENDNRVQAALWVGSEFAANASRLGVALPPLPNSSVSVGDDGIYWVGPAHHVWRVIDSWIVLAFRRSVRQNNSELALLMPWAMPERDETRAAIWYTMKEKRQGNLDWWTRLARDHGDLKATVAGLATSYDRLVSECLSQKPRWIIGLCAWAKGGDNEVAKSLSQKLSTRRLSFGQWLRQQAKKEGGQVDRRTLQRKGQEMIEKHGALEFCLEVLEDVPQDISIPNAQFVIDGIRHTEVWESLRALVGDDQFLLAHIERSESVRRELLMQDEHLPPEVVDQVMNDPTEREISIVASRASRRFNWDQGVETITRALVGI